MAQPSGEELPPREGSDVDTLSLVAKVLSKIPNGKRKSISAIKSKGQLEVPLLEGVTRKGRLVLKFYMDSNKALLKCFL